MWFPCKCESCRSVLTTPACRCLSAGKRAIFPNYEETFTPVSTATPSVHSNASSVLKKPFHQLLPPPALTERSHRLVAAPVSMCVFVFLIQTDSAIPPGQDHATRVSLFKGGRSNTTQVYLAVGHFSLVLVKHCLSHKNSDLDSVLKYDCYSILKITSDLKG